MDSQKHDRPLGAAAAAILSSSLGCLAMGIANVSIHISPTEAAWLNWWEPVGPLSGVTGLGLIIWLVSWILLHYFLKKRYFLIPSAVFSFLILAVAMVIMFPPFYHSISKEPKHNIHGEEKPSIAPKNETEGPKKPRN